MRVGDIKLGMTQQRYTLAESWGSVSLSGVYLVVRGEGVVTLTEEK